MPTITPSVGRKVWFYRNNKQTAPLDATIVKVHATPEEATPETFCNLMVVDGDSGNFEFVTSVQAYDEPQDHPCFIWMPYQQQQAAKETAPAA